MESPQGGFPDPTPLKKGFHGQKTKMKSSSRHEFRLPKTQLVKHLVVFGRKFARCFMSQREVKVEISIKLAPRIYNNLLSIRKNGSNDFDVFKAALDQFERTTLTCNAFSYVKPWLKLKDALKWKEETEGSSQSSGSKRSRNPDGTSQQSDGRTRFDINDKPLDLEDEQPLHRPVGRNKAKKAASTASGSSFMDQFGEKFDRYVHVQETKVEMLSREEQKMIETKSVIQTKTNMKILKMKADGRPRMRRFGAISCDDGVPSSPT
uniref:No apical meristem-associated C-terminal domain-containing protein n=1 Tax=Lactuca sativa TaxID=4236 RepID=A0A9R1XEB1_LACSA|nr:hypothetical protein LSAT_V11C500271300 [Lactuca sativa]